MRDFINEIMLANSPCSENPYIGYDGIFNWEIDSNLGLINYINKVRSHEGYKENELVGYKYDNDIYYSFYVDTEIDNELLRDGKYTEGINVSLWAVVNNELNKEGIRDINIPLENDEKQYLINQAGKIVDELNNDKKQDVSNMDYNKDCRNTMVCETSRNEHKSNKTKGGVR